DSAGRITIANRAAVRMLDAKEGSVIGKPVMEIVPALEEVVSTALRDGRAEYRAQISLSHGGGDRTINVRVTTERANSQSHGYVITLDDITDLVAAQRTAAWAD